MTGTTATASAMRRRPRGDRRATAVLLALGLVLGVVAGTAWWRQPTAFATTGHGADFTMSPQPLAQFPTLFTVGQLAEGEETITLREVRHRWKQDETGIRLDFFVCSPAGNAWIGGFPQVDGDFSELCSELRPARPGTTMRLHPDGGDVLAYRATPTREGLSRLAWVEVEYTRGPGHLWQTGTQRIDEPTTIDVG